MALCSPQHKRRLRTAARYSNLCMLRLSWAGVRIRAGLHCLTASRDAPVVCIQKASIVRPPHRAAICCRVEPYLDQARCRCAAPRARRQRRPPALGRPRPPHAGPGQRAGVADQDGSSEALRRLGPSSSAVHCPVHGSRVNGSLRAVARDRLRRPLTRRPLPRIRRPWGRRGRAGDQDW
jgi:hypothetical protein